MVVERPKPCLLELLPFAPGLVFWVELQCPGMPQAAHKWVQAH